MSVGLARGSRSTDGGDRSDGGGSGSGGNSTDGSGSGGNASGTDGISSGEIDNSDSNATANTEKEPSSPPASDDSEQSNSSASSRATDRDVPVDGDQVPETAENPDSSKSKAKTARDRVTDMVSAEGGCELSREEEAAAIESGWK